jgi:hypothetical protein
MRPTLFVLAWVFVLGIAAYDVYFAWQYRVAFHEWELNPVARWAAGLYGLGAVVALKAALLTFALGVAWHCHRIRHRLEVPYTLFVGGVHLLLSVHYLVAHLA